MDIYTAEIQIKRLLEYFEDIEERKPLMYQKSKDRYRDLATNCLRVVKVISNILQDETLMFDDVEFSGTQKKDVYRTIESMEKEIQKMKNFIGYEQPVPSSRITSERRIEILLHYEKVLKDVSFSDIPYSAVSNCAKLIWTWYEARFSNAKLHPNFRYNIRRIRDWLVSIVILYGKYHEDRDVSTLVQMFHSWIGELDNPKYDKYAVPYEVYNMSKNISPDDMTLSAIVIWDILKDFGYSDLFNYDGELVPKEDDIYNMFASTNPSILDRYRNYQFDVTIVSECRLQEV